MQTLAVKYRPKTWDDVVAQRGNKVILKHQLETNTFVNAYLFCGGAGTGKTTCARIFARDINKGQGEPIQLDAASNSGVENVREIINQAKLRSVNSEYKVFIIDECHALSSASWQAFLKLIEEPPAKSIFIFCTTDPDKIPKTILSRVQIFKFRQLSTSEVLNRLKWILKQEYGDEYENDPTIDTALFRIATIAGGGMREAITLLDTCLSYSKTICIDNVNIALGLAPQDLVMKFIYNYMKGVSIGDMFEVLDEIQTSGVSIYKFLGDVLRLTTEVVQYAYDVPISQLSLGVSNYARDWYSSIWDKTDSNDRLYNLMDFVLKVRQSIRYDDVQMVSLTAQLLLNW